jgi:acetylornithine deacetylase/succinyl-diaminopimelate desuccinylase-like protein
MAPLSLEDFERDALPTLLQYCEIPCLSPQFDEQWQRSGHLSHAAELLATWARARKLADFDVTIHQLEGRTPVLCVTVEATGPGSGTAVLYGHLDKQPPLGDWSEGLDPFIPVRRGDRIYARGAADDGYSTFSALLALEAMEGDGTPHSRCVVLIEASEESGSPDLEVYLDALKDHLGRVELMVCLDSSAPTYDRLWVTNSLRGLVNLDLTVRVLERAVHSGSASGVVPSSFRILRELLDRVEDATTGRVLVDELHAKIPAEHVEAALDIAAEFGDLVGDELPVLEGVQLMGTSPEDNMLRRNWHPALSIIGMSGIPEPAIAGNVLRTSTTAVLSLRLPPSVPSQQAVDALTRTLVADAPSSAIVTVECQSAADGWVAPPLAPWLRAALEAASLDAFGHAPGYTGEGGSIPFLASLGRRYPAVQFVATGVLGPESNAHGIDEMLDLQTAVGVTNAVITVLGAYARLSKDS